MAKAVFILILISNSFWCFSQSAVYTRAGVLEKIYALQCKHDAFYRDGLFASERISKRGRRVKEDNNIFFTALINYTLESIRKDFNDEQQMLLDTLVRRAKSNYPYYKNRNGDITYNFWMTKPESPMPNSKFWSNRNRFKLADDLDDTSLIFLSIQDSTRLDSLLKKKMSFFTNSSGKSLRSTFKKYRKYEAYYSWFGKKMKQDLDICVLSNVLLFSVEKNLPLNKFDRESISLIKEMIQNRDHLNHPHIVSPWYQNSAIILYNLARLIAKADHELLNEIRDQVVLDIREQLKITENRMEQIILLSSLARLGETLPMQINLETIENDFMGFEFFYINPFAGSAVGIKRILGPSNLAYYKSDAYCWTLILEYLVLCKR